MNTYKVENDVCIFTLSLACKVSVIKAKLPVINGKIRLGSQVIEEKEKEEEDRVRRTF